MKERIINKLISGRFIFTIVAATVFAHLSMTGRLSIDKVGEILLIVIYAYFTRSRKKEEEE